MSNVEIISKIEELKEIEALVREAQAEAEALKEEIKMELEKQGKEEMIAGRYVVRNTNVTSNRFDAKAFQKVMPEVYKLYVRTTQSKRFSIVG